MESPSSSLSFRKQIAFRVIIRLIPIGCLLAGIDVYLLRASSVIAGSNGTGYLAADAVRDVHRRLTRAFRTSAQESVQFDGWNNILRMVPVPFVTMNYYPNIRSPWVNTNDLGFRGTLNYSAQIRAARAVHARGGRVVVLTGGSAAFGWGADSDETDIASLLERRLADRGRDVVVFNFGMGYYTSNEELAAVALWARDLDGDLLIDYNGFNDMARSFPDAYGFVFRQNPKIHFGYPIVRRSYPAEFYSEYLDARPGTSTLNAVLDNYVSNMRLMGDLMAARGRTLIIATQLIQGYDNGGHRGIRPSYDDLVGHYPRFIEAAQGLGRERESTVVINTATSLHDNPQPLMYFGDMMHLTSRGQRLVVDEVFPAVEAALDRIAATSSTESQR